MSSNPDPDPHPDPDLTIVLLGNTGAGKSASGNTILGRSVFESRLSFKSVTKQICTGTGNVFGKQISVVDTPGILDTKNTYKKIQTFCQELLESSKRCLFLVVVKVGRFTKEEHNAVKAAKRALGPQGLKKSYLLFTGGDALETKSLDEFIFEDENKGTLPNLVKMFAAAYHLFNNEVEDEEQVRELLLKSGHLGTQQRPDPPADVSRDRRIVLLGLPGAGKSSSGNTILGSKMFKRGCDFDSVSTETVSKSATVEGRQVTVVDTPGFTDKLLSPRQLSEEIMKSVVAASPGPHAFVIVVRIGGRIVDDKSIKLFDLLRELFGSDASQHSMVLFTCGDELEDESIDKLIQSSSCVSDLVSMCAGRYCVFNNKAKKSREQVRNFLNKIDEMVTGNGGQHFTNEMFRIAETFLNEEMNRAGETTGRTTGETTGETTGRTTGRTTGETTGETTGRTTGRTTGETTGEESGVWKKFLNFLDIHKCEIIVGVILGAIFGSVVGGKAGGVAGGVVGAVVGGVVGGVGGGVVGVLRKS